MRITMIIAAVSLFGSPTIASAQEDFCADLNALKAEAGDGFVSLRGAQQTSYQAPNHEYVTYATTRSLAGALRCESDYIPDNGKSSNFMTCFFAPAATKLATVERTPRLLDPVGGLA
jgi:hypothetical protein